MNHVRTAVRQILSVLNTHTAVLIDTMVSLNGTAETAVTDKGDGAVMN